jgi:hypothetical protein
MEAGPSRQTGYRIGIRIGKNTRVSLVYAYESGKSRVRGCLPGEAVAWTFSSSGFGHRMRQHTAHGDWRRGRAQDQGLKQNTHMSPSDPPSTRCTTRPPCRPSRPLTYNAHNGIPRRRARQTNIVDAAAAIGVRHHRSHANSAHLSVAVNKSAPPPRAYPSDQRPP